MYRGKFSCWVYSSLEQITPANVKKLVPAWTFSTGVNEGHQSPPIVNNGVMFVTTPQQQVFALNAKTGDQIWRYKKELPEDLLQLHPTNRGVALWEDRIFLATVDAHLIALDAKTGKVLWDTTVDNYKNGYYFTLAPLVAKGKVMIGTSGGELGIRGYIAAFDARDGKPAWKTYTVPGPGAPGPQRLPLAARAARRRHQVRGRAAVRDPGGLHQDRPGDRTPILRQRAQAARGCHGHLLSRALGR